jgi:glycosyltransferase involved in cell wall biosynthesis
MKRILHVVGGLDCGGAETWLAQVYRAMDRSQYSFDFLVHSRRPFHYEEDVKSNGANIIVCDGSGNPLRYAMNLSTILREFGPYDCVHSHVHFYSGYISAVAAANRVPLRIVQSHIDSSFVEQEYTFTRQVYARTMRKLISFAANRKIAVSTAAGNSLFGDGATSTRTWSFLPLGIDLEPYKAQVIRDQVRAEFGLASDSIAIFHVGRFDEQKNHKFLVDIAASLCAMESHSRFFFVGDGPLRSQIQDQVRSHNLDARVQFLGIRKDVPRLLQGAADLFLFPSLYEGLGLVHIEAQLAGLLSIASDAVPIEADILPKRVIRLRLASSATEWATEIATLIRSGIAHWNVDLSALEEHVSIQASARHLANLYSSAFANVRNGSSLASDNHFA